MNILNGFSSDLYSGHRVLRVSSYEEFKNMRFPTDCEVMAINKNPDVKEIYMAQIDNMGNFNPGRYSYEELPEVKYVTMDQFNELKEEIRNGFNSLKSAPVSSNNNGSKPGNGNK